MSKKQSPLPVGAEEMEWMKLDNQLCFRLYAASKAITRAYRPLLEPLRLTYPQYLVMLYMWQSFYEDASREISIKDVGNKLRLDTGTLTPLLKRLEALGYIERQRSDSDERRVLLHLTKPGIALSKQAKQVPQALFCHLNLPVELLMQLSEQMDKLLATLNVAESQ